MKFYVLFAMSLINQLFVRQVRLLKINSILRILIISIGISGNVSAQSLDRYCLSTIGKIETANKTPVFDPTPSLPYFIDSVENLPKLYKKPCTKFYRFFWGRCDRRTFFSYSPTLNRVFIQGHRRTDWGGNFAHLEISPSGTKSVPESLVNSDFLEDLPTLNGAVFKSDEGEALFYNGSQITNLSSSFPEQKKRKNNNNGRNWNLKKTIEGRFFIVDNGFYSKHFPFVMELKTGINIEFIDVPKKVTNQPWEFYTLKNDSRLWVLSRRSILTETNGKLKEVVDVYPDNIITVNTTFEQLKDGSIFFQVENTDTKSITNYFLRKASPTANCEIMLDTSKPVLLKPELEN